MSVNLLVGANVIDNGRFKADAAFLVGFRDSSLDCPDSYLGYQCYADEAPTPTYKENLGAVITISFDRFTLGVRATGESTQVIAGLRF